MTNVIDFTKYHDSIRWTLANGWNIYIWNRMLQDQERTIQEEEKKFLSPETAFPFIPGASKGAPPLNPANIGMPIDPEYTTGQAGEINLECQNLFTESDATLYPPEIGE